MTKTDVTDDLFKLSRFISSQKGVYDTVLYELKNGQKRTHWMWYIFPQIEGLGYSPMSKLYSIKSIEEAAQYLKHPVLGPRLIECSEAVLSISGLPIRDIFGYPDNLKLKSSMTLFDYISEQSSVFARVLEKYFNGDRDKMTLAILKELKSG